METETPRETFLKGSVPERTAAARDLARIGTWDDLPAIVEVGWTEKSTSVRLYAAAAAADIVARHRGAFGQDTLSTAQAEQVFAWAFGGDPGTNPSMLMMAAGAPGPQVLRRLGRILRDPRSDVRLGAITALRRMVLSAAAEPAPVAEAVAGWLDDDRIPPDTLAELVKIVGEADLQAARDAVLTTAGRTPGFVSIRDESLDRLDARRRPETWSGLFRSDGLDVFEVAEAPRADDFAVCDGESWSAGDDTLALDPAAGTLGGEPVRLVWATPIKGPERIPAVQIGGRTWWKVADDALVELLESRWEDLSQLGDSVLAVLQAEVAELEGAAGQRARVIAAWLAGDHEAALAILDPLLDRKRPRTDLFWWRGRVRASTGDAAGAAEDLEVYLGKVKKNAPYREAAEALKGSL